MICWGVSGLQALGNGTDIYALSFGAAPQLSAVAGLSRDVSDLLLGPVGGGSAFRPGDSSYLTLSYNDTGGLELTVDNSTNALQLSAERTNSTLSTIEWVTSTDLASPMSAPAPSTYGQADLTPEPLSTGLTLSAATAPNMTTLTLADIQRNISYNLGELDGVSVTLDRFRTSAYEFLTVGFSSADWHHDLAFAQNDTFSGFELRNASQPGLTLLGTTATAIAKLPRIAVQALVPNFGQKPISALGVFADTNPDDLLLMATVRPITASLTCEKTVGGWQVRANGSETQITSSVKIALPQPQVLAERSGVQQLNEKYPAPTSPSLG